MGQRPILDSRHEFRWQEPATAGERRTAGVYIGSIALIITLVVLAVVFDQFAATGVLLVAFLSVILVYLLAPVTEWLRHHAAPWRRDGHWLAA